jgi:neopullulanase
MPVDTPAWARDAVFYQIFPDRFAASERVPKPGPLEPWDAPPTIHGFKGGDLLGIAERLDDLLDLGVNALYLTPIFRSASNHRYHTDDYLAVDPLLGGDAALRELLDAAHARGLRVVLDGVFNHCGRGFWPFHHVVESGAGSPYRGYFHLDDVGLDRGRRLRPYPTLEEEGEIRRLAASIGAGAASRQVLGYEGWWGLPALPKLCVTDPELRAHLLDVAVHWVRFGIDGWRLDVAEEIEEAFWEEFRERVRAVDPEAYLVAEIWHPKPEWLTGRHFDALMNYPLAEAILGYAAGDHLDLRVTAEHQELAANVWHRDGLSFAAELERLTTLYPPEVTNVMLDLLGSHDTPRIRTICGGDVTSIRLATLLQMTLPGAPCIYYGDEVGMEGHKDPDCRRAFPWDRARWAPGLREEVRELVWLRRRHPALRDGGLRVAGAADGAVAYLRWSEGETFLVACNVGGMATGLDLDVGLAAPGEVTAPTGDPTVALAVGASGGDVRVTPAAEDTGATRVMVEVPARTGAVIRLH